MKEPRQPETEASAADGKSSPISATGLLYQLVPLLLVAIGCEKLLLKLCHLPENAYGSSILFTQIGQQSKALSLVTFAFVGACALAFLHPKTRRKLFISWPELCSRREIRWLIVLAALPLVWRLTSHEYNYYWDQGYPIDRLLIGLCFLILPFRPVASAPLVLISLPVLFQFNYPLLGATWTTSSMAVRILIFFLAYLGVVLASNSRFRNDRILLFGLLLIVSLHYWSSGWQKVTSGWLLYDRIHVLFSATTSSGWLLVIDQDQLDKITRTLATIDFPLRFGTQIIELSPLLLAWGRRSLSLFLLCGFASFHIGVVLLTGIFFWEWILIEVGWAVTILHFSRSQPDWPSLSRSASLFYTMLIGTSTLWYQAPTLFWFDAAASYSYEFQARDQDGRLRRLPQNFFEPTSYEIRLQNLDFLVPNTAQMKITFGATDRETSQLLLATQSPEDLLKLEKRIGTIQSDAIRAKRFEAFVQRFIANYNRRPNLKRAWSGLTAPYCLLELFPPDTSQLPESIDQLEIYEILSFFDGNKTHIVRRQLISTIDIEISE